MMEKFDRVEFCRNKYHELFGGEPAGNEGTDPEFMRILQRFIFGEVCAVGSLDNRMRELVTVTVLAVNQTLPQLRAHVGAALNVGCTPLEIREAVYQLAAFVGFPKTLNAISAMNEAFTAAGISLPLEDAAVTGEDDRYEKGLAFQSEIYGDGIKRKYAYLPEEFAEAIPRFLTELCFGDLMMRRGLDRKTRELLTVVMFAAMGDSAPQIQSHALGARKAGNTDEEIYAALLHALPYTGFPRVFNALNALKEVM